MKRLISYCLENPVVIMVGMIFLLLFGYLSVIRMPYALTPKISRPIISITTTWAGATPYEVEKEIVQRQEKYLKNLPNLLTMTSSSRQSAGSIVLEFKIGTNTNEAFLDVSSKLNEVRGYPSDIDRPVIRPTGDDVAPIVFMFARSLDKSSIRHKYLFLMDDVVKYYERLPGVGSVTVSGGVPREIHIALNTNSLAFYNITVDDVTKALQAQNINVSAGTIDYAQRTYRVRTVGVYGDVQDIYNTVIKASGAKVVRLKDIASVIDTFAKPTSPNIHDNDETVTMLIRPTNDGSVLEVVKSVKELTAKLNKGILKDNHIKIDLGRDSSSFIQDAINLVKENVFEGIILAAIVLYLFLRSIYTVFVVSLIIPLSILSSFIILNALDRTLNVILLAGVSFAISMIIDSSIVVVENIHRHHSMGKRMFEACKDGVSEVAGALFASTVTTIAIFIPIIGLKDEMGQFFVDIALASSSALIISFIVCLFGLPMLYYTMAKYFLKKKKKTKILQNNEVEELAINSKYRFYNPKWLFDTMLGIVGKFLFNIIDWILRLVLKNVFTRLAVIIVFCVCSVFISIKIFPKLDYLPKGSQNFILGYVSIPNGLSYAERLKITDAIYNYNKPYLQVNGFKGDDKYPAIKDFFVTASPTLVEFYEISADPKRAKDLIPLMRDTINSIPNITGTVVEQGMFSASRISSSVDVNIIGYDLDSMIDSTRAFINLAHKYLPGARIRAIPSLDLGNKEITLYPNERALSINGLSVKSFGNIVDVLIDGKKVGDFRDNYGRLSDIMLTANQEAKSPEDMLYTQIYTPSKRIVPLSSLADIKYTQGVSQIRHYEQERNLLISINPSDKMPLQSVLETISDKIIPELKASGELENNKVVFSGNANKLYKLASELGYGFLLALGITYLILAALYGNFIYPFIIIFTVPFAVAGGLLGLWFVNKYIAVQNLDVLTMLGFIILVGSVVNNAILIVYQSLINLKEHKMEIFASVYEATRSRIRPIYMGMLTTVLALFPLIFSNGAGSEIYRGLGAVIAGGLLVSTIISVFVIPSLLLFVLRKPNDEVA
ncbi:efflux RND transporter permease subunit [Helicobacter sp. 11S02629-2]|uniref:efflux RND transporter permease subunit n=1 Tax=Helicobacter sp. 11S02629-2 TaxID=1476195 RepID=UPI000BA5795C|nr:efflux RND transporter permease subunit [Helicobacter sp. 11S02629-2]PAF45466.1 hypothetical protein BKH40_03100 [Helicobacter sp. 11S02629-2]